MFKKIKAITRTVNSDIRALEDTGLFMPDWYCGQYPEAVDSGLSPIEHFVRVGQKKEYDPNPYFDQQKYLKSSAAARRFDGPAVVHYARHAWKKGRNPSIRFSVSLYLKHYPEVAEAGMEPLRHFLLIGQKQGYAAFPQRFEKEAFQHLASDMAAIQASGLFQENWYKQHHTDMWHDDISPLVHFVTKGKKELRKPNPFFDTPWYAQAYANQIGDDNPLVFYIRKGWKKGHPPSSEFCVTTYAKRAKFKPKSVEPLSHYIQHGLKKKEDFPYPPARKDKPVRKLDRKARLPVGETFRSMVDFERKPLADTGKAYSPDNLNIHWIIPDFAAGGGGHMTIFRMIHLLEVAGHDVTVWLHNPSIHKTAEAAYQTIVKHFQHFKGEVKLVEDGLSEAEGDALIATDCWSVWPALSATKFIRRFYFVQDFEPSFHPMGASYLAAEATYKEDLDCICASPWLAQLMQDNYGRWAAPFWLAADTETYHPAETPHENPVPRIALYARHFTARRAVELAMLALETLSDRGVDFIVDFFGSHVPFQSAPFKYVDHGVAKPEELSAIFQKADIGVVFSATNYSLVPQEMMACKLPIVELDGESTRAIFPPDTVSLAKPDPVAIADEIEALIADPSRQAKQAEAAYNWVKDFSWQKSADMVEGAIKKRLEEFGTPVKAPQKKASEIKASVVIPTLNAGPLFDRVLAAATQQRAPWNFEILVIDSGSTDETLEIIAKYPEVRLHQIDKKDFNHGDTRNLGVELTNGEFIAFLTHDALPANNRWLFNLVTSIEHYPDAAGAFGKHLPWPDASPFTKRDLNAHFEMMASQPLYVDRDTNKIRYRKKDPQWMQFLHFYSDNNSCLRRSVWEKIPYRRTKFGEDQLWAYDIIRAGYGKVYAHRAVVFHSHDFQPKENRERNMTESAFFKHFFGYVLMKDEKTLKITIEAMRLHDNEWAKNNNIPRNIVRRHHKLTEARLEGYLEGARIDTSKMF